MGKTRNPIYLVLAIVAALVAVGLILLFLATGSDAPPTASPDQSAKPEPSATSGTPTTAPDPKLVEGSDKSTSLNITVADCDGCQVTAQPTRGSTDLQPLSATVADGAAQLDMPTSTTLGLVLSIRGENDGVDLQDDKLVILSAKGMKAGSSQVEENVRKADSGQYCWAGTTLDVATIRLTVSGDSASPQAAWADPALPTTGGGNVKLTDGAAQVPDKLDCG